MRPNLDSHNLGFGHRQVLAAKADATRNAVFAGLGPGDNSAHVWSLAAAADLVCCCCTIIAETEGPLSFSIGALIGETNSWGDEVTLKPSSIIILSARLVLSNRGKYQTWKCGWVRTKIST